MRARISMAEQIQWQRVGDTRRNQSRTERWQYSVDLQSIGKRDGCHVQADSLCEMYFVLCGEWPVQRILHVWHELEVHVLQALCDWLSLCDVSVIGHVHAQV